MDRRETSDAAPVTDPVRWRGRVARLAVSFVYIFGWWVILMGAVLPADGGGATDVASVCLFGGAVCVAALGFDRLRRRSFPPPAFASPAITDPRTTSQLRIQRLLALAGAALTALLLHVGLLGTNAESAKVERLRASGERTVGTVIDTRAARWWVRNDSDRVTIVYRRTDDPRAFQVAFDVSSRREYPVGRSVGVVYDPNSRDAIVDGVAVGVGDGLVAPFTLVAAFISSFVIAYQLNNIRRVSRIVRSYPWQVERIVSFDQESPRGFTKMFVAIGRPELGGQVLVRLAHGSRSRRRMIHEGTTLRIAGNPLDDVAIDIPKSRLLVPAGPTKFEPTEHGHPRITRVDKGRAKRLQKAMRRRR